MILLFNVFITDTHAKGVGAYQNREMAKSFDKLDVYKYSLASLANVYPWKNVYLCKGLLNPTIHYQSCLSKFPPIKNYVENLTFQIPDSISKSCIEICDKAKANKEIFKYCVVYFTSNYEKSNIMGMDAVFVDMVEKYYKTNQAFWADSVTLFKIKDRSDKLKPLLLGKTAPNLTLKDSAGVYQTLYNLKNRFTILAFWDPD
jgi:hypothetical protein